MKSTFSASRAAYLFVICLLTATAFSVPAVAQREGGSEPPEVLRPVKFDISPPLRSITPILSTKEKKAEDDRGPIPTGIERHDADPNAQTTMGRGVFGGLEAIPPTGANFAGMFGTAQPPDPNGDIGPNHYVQMVNSRYQVFNRSGVSILGPANINTLWSGFGGPCQTENAGDPVVMYDQLADRWFLSQFTDSIGPFFNCVAVSTTGDPTGSYARYAFEAPSFPDYPKYSVWSDAYYLNTREGSLLGLYALDRTAMLAGQLALAVKFTLSQTSSGGTGPNGLLNADIEGTTLPPAGSPNYMVGTKDNDFGAASDALIFFRFHVDFVTPVNSTFLGPIDLPIAPLDTNFPCLGGPGTRTCIPQPGTANRIDILSYRQRPTWRLSYRNFGTHESLVTSQSVEAAPGMAGMRWWEIRNPGPSPVLFQDGTFAPGATDGIHRWMGSIAMDKRGNMALGYSVSDATSVFPGIRYTGRLAGDPLGTMPQGEGTIVDGGGSQTGHNRWGDYTSMNVDPVDDCTFWYTNEYFAATSSSSYVTRVGSFKFPSCDAPAATRAPADFDLDGKSDIVVFRPSNGTWFVLKSQTGTSESLTFGQNGDVSLDADFDGDRKADYTVWRPGTGEWFFRRSTNGTFGGALWGVNGDLPVPADYDADGMTDFAVWRPSDGLNYIVRSTGGFLGVQWGANGDIPSNVDINADGKTDFRVFRPTNGTWFTLINGTTTNESFPFGQNGDIPVRGDFDGDQKGDLAVWRPSTGQWFFRRSTDGTFGGLQWGANGDKPVVGDYDGDSRSDFGVFRPSNGIHYIVRNAGGFIGFQWGAPGDLAPLGAPLP